MYEEFFNLTTKPFDLLPNPDFLFPSKSHRRAVAYLDYGIRERAGFILLTGEVGSGKTTIIRDLVKKFGDAMVLAKVFNTSIDSRQLLAMVNTDFGLAVEGKDKIGLFRDLNDFLIDQYARGNRPTLIIDEAQNLTPDILEEVRMLSNLETDDAKLLQIILVGQPELRDTLSQPGLLQLRQRISINCHINPLCREEVSDYIQHRLHVAGNRDAVAFSSAAYEIVYRYSRGIPRLVNIICDFLLLSAFVEESRQIDEDIVRDVIGDLEFEKHFWSGDTSPAEVEVKKCSPVSRDEVMPDRADLKSMLLEMTKRFDSLQKESEVFRTMVTHDLNVKLSHLASAFRQHIAEHNVSLSALKLNDEQGAVVSDSDGHSDRTKAAKQGFLWRILK